MWQKYCDQTADTADACSPGRLTDKVPELTLRMMKRASRSALKAGTALVLGSCYSYNLLHAPAHAFRVPA